MESIIIKQDRNYTIELFRFIGCIAIFFAHIPDAYIGDFAKHGYMAVDFYFIISSYYMAQKAFLLTRENSLSDRLIAEETWLFIRRKISSFAILYYLAYGLLFLSLHISNKNLIVWKDLARGIPELLFVQTISLGREQTIHLCCPPLWYISAMMVGSLIMFPAILKMGKLFTTVVSPLIFFVLMSYLASQSSSLVKCFYNPWD